MARNLAGKTGNCSVGVQIIEGTWEEIVRHGEQLSGKRVRLTVLPDHEAAGSPPAAPLYLTATPEEFRKAFDALGKGNEHLPVLPPEAFDREHLYADDEEVL